MTTTEELDLLVSAEIYRVTVETSPDGLRPNENGKWFPDRRLIHLRPGMGPTNRLYTLAHELGHAVLGHMAHPPPWLHARQEREADEWAAGKLIPRHKYEEAEIMIGHHPGALAKELGVTTRLIHVWRNLHERKLTP